MVLDYNVVQERDMASKGVEICRQVQVVEVKQGLKKLHFVLL